MSVNRKTVLIIVGLLLIGIVGGAAAAIGLGLDETVAVSYGSVEYEQSDLVVNDWQINGPGVNVDDVDVDVENTGDESRTADVTVYLMDDDAVVSSGTTSAEWDDGEQSTVNVDVDRVREHEFDSIEIRIEE